MAKSSIEKYTTRVEQIKRTGKTHKQAQRQASAEFKGKKVSGTKKKKRSAKRPLYRSSFTLGSAHRHKKRKKKVGKTGPVQKLRKAHEKEGLLLAQIGSIATQKSRLKNHYNDALAKELLKKDQATTKTAKKKHGKKIIALRKKIKGLIA
jgi:hypothetical protein